MLAHTAFNAHEGVSYTSRYKRRAPTHSSSTGNSDRRNTENAQLGKQPLRSVTSNSAAAQGLHHVNVMALAAPNVWPRVSRRVAPETCLTFCFYGRNPPVNCPPGKIQALCRWQSPELLLTYRRLGLNDHKEWIEQQLFALNSNTTADRSAALAPAASALLRYVSIRP